VTRFSRREFGALVAIGGGVPLGRGAADLAARFRLGITGDEVSDDLGSVLRFAREFKLRWLEVRNLGGRYATEVPVDELRQVRAALDAQGIGVSVLDTALYKCTLPGTRPVRPVRDDYAYSAQGALLRRALERSEVLGTRFIRAFSFWRVEQPATVFDRVVEEISRAAELARTFGRTLLIENVGNANVETGAEAARLLRALPANVGLLWDPNNAYCGGEVPFPDGYRALDRKRLHHVHLRDARRDGSGQCRWLPVGKGAVDNLGLLGALVRDGFMGTLNLETHYRRADGNRELASRESMQGLLGLLAKI
jgi:sugar phosphate isomerase/epimerase